MKKKIIVTLFIIISSCFSYTQGQSETCLQNAARPAGKGGSMFNQKKKKMITALNSPKYKLSIDDMRTIAGGKK